MHGSMDTNCLGQILKLMNKIFFRYEIFQILQIYFFINVLVKKLQNKLLIQLQFSQLNERF